MLNYQSCSNPSPAFSPKQIKMKEESTEVKQEPKETFLVSITVPAPQTDASFGYDVTVTLSPRKMQHTSTCQNQVTLAPLSLHPIPALSTVATPPASGEFAHLIAIYPNDGLRTLPMVQPETNPSGGYGRKYKAFYVVSRGRRTGVFYDYWAELQPLVNGIKGGKWQRAESLESAIKIYNEDVAAGESSLLDH